MHEGDLSLAHAWHHLVHEMLHFDGRILQSIWLLFARPGQLTLDFLEGRRARHVHPVRLFLVFSAIFSVSTSGVTAPEFYRGRGGQLGSGSGWRQKAETQGVAYETTWCGRWTSPPPVDPPTGSQHRHRHRPRILVLAASSGVSASYLAEHMVTALHLACVGDDVRRSSVFVDRASGNPWTSRPTRAA